jgi:hypothetical protein
MSTPPRGSSSKTKFADNLWYLPEYRGIPQRRQWCRAPGIALLADGVGERRRNPSLRLRTREGEGRGAGDGGNLVGERIVGTGPLVGAFGRDGAKELKRYDEDFDVGSR